MQPDDDPTFAVVGLCIVLGFFACGATLWLNVIWSFLAQKDHQPLANLTRYGEIDIFRGTFAAMSEPPACDIYVLRSSQEVSCLPDPVLTKHLPQRKEVYK